MPRRLLVIVVAFAAASAGFAGAKSAEAVPAFARQYDVQCNVCHTRPPRLNSFGEQFHLMGFQMPSAARPEGLVGSVKEDGWIKTLIDSLAVRVVGGIFEYSESPGESEGKFAPPDEIELFITRAVTPDLSLYVELEYEPKGVSFSPSRGYFTEQKFGLGKEAFFMANLGQLLGLLGAPTMEMGGMTMVGRHGGFNMHGPMLMAGKIDPSTNFSYATNRQLILDTEIEIEKEPGAPGEVHRLPVVPYALTSKFFGLFKNRDDSRTTCSWARWVFSARTRASTCTASAVLIWASGVGSRSTSRRWSTGASASLARPSSIRRSRARSIRAAAYSTASAWGSPPMPGGRRSTSTVRSSGIGSSACPATSAVCSTGTRPGSRSRSTISCTRR